MMALPYRLRILTGMSFDKFSQCLDRAHQVSGKNKLALTLDMVHCARKFGAGYYDYVTFGFWDLNDRQRATYVTRVVSKKLVTLLNDTAYEHTFNDKEEFNQVFAEFVGRDFVNYRTASKEEVKAFVEKHPIVFAKPAHGSCGHDCQKIDSRDYPDFDAFYEDLGKKDAWLLEKVLEQHPDNAAVYPNAMNCLRLITLIDSQGEPHVIFATQKFGLNGRVVDNYGFGCRVDLATGKICSPGVSGDGSLGIVYEKHPQTGVTIQGRTVPLFFEACEMVKMAALRIPQMRYIGWDVGITPEGPAIVEGNNYCAHDFWQLPAQTPEKTGMLPVFEKYVPELKL
jgi:hypothetical protein